MTQDQSNHRGETVINAAAKDSRAQEARMLPHTGDLTAQQIQSVKKKVDARCDELGIDYEKVDQQIGCSRKATRRFMSGNYEHDDSKFARRLDRWLKMGEESHDGLPTTYVTTDVAEKMIGMIKRTAMRRSVGLIIGPSGTSKSTVLKSMESLIPGAVRVELRSTDRTLVQFLRRICTDLGGPRNSDAQLHMRWLVDFFQGSKRLIMIDEAHFLDKRAMNGVRDLHKATGCPVILCGTQDLASTINDFDQFHGQLKSIVSMTYNVSVEAMNTRRPLYSIDEVIEYAKAMNLRLDTSAADEVTMLASTLGWGGLRSAGYLMLNANLLSRGGLIKLKHINSALREMEGYDGFDRTKNKAASTSSRKVAVA